MKIFTRFLLILTIAMTAAGVKAKLNSINENSPERGKLIFSETFDSEDSFKNFTVIDNNKDNISWQYENNGYAKCMFSSSVASDDWLLTPELTLEKDKVYLITFKTWGSYSDYTEQIGVSYGKGTDPYFYNSVDPGIKVFLTGIEPEYTVIAKEDGVYHFGFHATSEANQGGLNLDNIKITEISNADAPAHVNLLKTTANEGAASVTISFYTPNVTNDEAQLTSITKAEIYRDNELIHTIDNPETNKRFTYTDDEAKDGENTYTVVCYNEAGAGMPLSSKVYAGEDIPGKVSNVVLQDNGDYYTLSWTAPTKGENNKYFTAANVKYNIYSVEGYGKFTLLKSDVEATQVKLDAIGGDQRRSTLAVAAKNNTGEGAKKESNTILMGDSYNLPIMQNFDNQIIPNLSEEGTDEYGHYWWRTSANSSYFAYSSDCLLWYKTEDAYDYTYYNTGKINFTHTVNPVLTFKYNITNNDASTLKVEAVTPDQKVIVLKELSAFTDDFREWSKQEVKLDKLKGLNNVIIRFHGMAGEKAGEYVGLDDISILDVTEHNLYAQLALPDRAVAGLPITATVKVSNYGTKDADNYTVKLYANDEMVAEKSVSEALKSLKTTDISITFTPKVGDNEMKIYAVVENENEESLNDNTTKTIVIPVAQPNMQTVNNLQLNVEGNCNKLSWTAIKANKEKVTDDFENYPAFTLPGDGHYLEYEYNIGQWYNYDEDKEYSLDIPGYTFNWEEEAFSFITFNAEKVSLDASAEEGSKKATDLGIFDAHSGKQFLAAFSMKEDMSIGNKVSDWLVSPQLSGDAQTISFWVNSLNGSNGITTYEVAYSTTDSLYDSFKTVLLKDTVNKVEWREVTVDLPAGAKYFAIHHTTPIDNFQMLMLDDVTYTKGTGDVLGYKIYRDGKYLTTVTSPYFADDNNNAHKYQVTVLYNCGESGFSNSVVNTSTGIDNVTKDNAKIIGVYNLQGNKTQHLSKGVNIIKYSNGTIKKLIVK